MAGEVKSRDLPQTATYDPTSDFFMLVRGDENGPSSGPYLLFASAVIASYDGGTGGSGDYGYGGGPFGGGSTASVTSVFGRKGVISADVGDYTAAKITYSAGATGIPATTTQEAIDYLVTYGGGGSGGLPVGGSEGQVATRDGAGGVIWTDQVVTTVFGRDGTVVPVAGDYHADQIAVTTDGVTPTTNQFVTASDLAKIAALDPDLQLPDPSGETIGHVLKVSASNTAEWAAEAGGSAGVGQIDLGPHLRPDSSASPTWVYATGTGTWEFLHTTAQALFCEFRWPGVDMTLELILSCAATSGNVGFSVSLAAVTPGSADLYNKAFATANSDDVAVADASGKTVLLSIPLTNDDSAADGDMVRMKIAKDNTVGSNAAGTTTLRLATLVPTP